MIGDSAYDTLDWHDHLLVAGVVPVAPYNPRNTDEPLDIKYRVEARIENHSEDVHLKQSVLDETYNCRTQVKRTNDAVKDWGFGRGRARGRVHARTQVFLALGLRFVVAITNHKRETPQDVSYSRYETNSMTRSPRATVTRVIPVLYSHSRRYLLSSPRTRNQRNRASRTLF